MREKLALLCQLQQLDRERARLMAERERVPVWGDVRPLWQEAHKLHEQLTQTTAELLKTGQELQHKEAQLAVLSQQRQQLEQQLYGGGTSNAKELTQIQTKAEQLARQDKELEAAVMELLERIEYLQDRRQLEEAAFTEKKASIVNRERELATKFEELTTQIATIDAERAEYRQAIDADLLDTYDQLCQEKGTALAMVHNGICSGCRVGLPQALINQVQEMKQLHRCENCGRILY